MAKKSLENYLIWGAVVLGGGFLIYKLFNPGTATPAVASNLNPAGAGVPAGPNIEQNLDTALTNIATGASGLFSGLRR